MKLAQTFGGEEDENYLSAKRATDQGYVYVFIQAPGTIGSTGPRVVEYMPIEVDAISMVVDWIVDQSWSNRKVGAFGTSYTATTSDFAAATKNPAIKAVVPTAPGFDVYSHVIRPGGVLSAKMARIWGTYVHGMDIDNICEVVAADKENQQIPFWKCLLTKLYIKGSQRPADAAMDLFDQAIREHGNNPDVQTVIRKLEFKDQNLVEISDNQYITAEQPFSLHDVATYQYREKANRARVNNLTIVSWMDAGVAEGALQKYLSFDTPLRIMIHPRSHGARFYVDPFAPTRPLSKNEKEADWSDQIAFFDTYLKADSDPPSQKREIRYFTYGVNRWSTTEVCPPRGVETETWYFDSENALSSVPTLSSEGSDIYKVNYSATTGKFNRWMAQLGRKVVYDNRREEDAKLQVYTFLPMETDTEMTGSPTVNMFVASTHEDGAFHCYLEDVVPDGRVALLTEGILRAIHRKKADPATAPYVPLGVYHSLSKKDASPLVPGEITEISITLLPVSTVFRKGHRIRIAIAGHDKSMEDRYPREGIPVLTFERNRKHASNIELPIMKHQ